MIFEVAVVSAAAEHKCHAPVIAVIVKIGAGSTSFGTIVDVSYVSGTDVSVSDLGIFKARVVA